MNKYKIIKTLQSFDWISRHWRVKDFMVLETDEKIVFSYNHGDMGVIDKIIYNKKDGFTQVYEVDNYYGGTSLLTSLYL